MKIKNAVQLLLSILLLFVPVALSAEVISISATGEYVLGDNDTITEGKKLALQDAKRLAPEKVGTYLESTTEVKNGAVTVDEIRMYTAGIVKIEEIKEERSLLESKATVIKVNVRVSIDPDVLLKQIVSLRNRKEIENNARKLNSDNVRLRSEIDQLNQQLRSAVDEKKYRQLREQREEILEKIYQNEKGLTLLVSGEGLLQAAVFDKQKKQDDKETIRRFVKEIAQAYQISTVKPDIEDNGDGTATVKIDGTISLPGTYPDRYSNYSRDYFDVKIGIKSFEDVLSTEVMFYQKRGSLSVIIACHVETPRDAARRCKAAKSYMDDEFKRLNLVGTLGKFKSTWPWYRIYTISVYGLIGELHPNNHFSLSFDRVPLDELKEVSKIELKMVYQDDEIEPVKETKMKPTIKKAKKKRK